MIVVADSGPLHYLILIAVVALHCSAQIFSNRMRDYTAGDAWRAIIGTRVTRSSRPWSRP